ncbi:hypothetical protein V5735_03555 (plasmid) [Haladaptatus sp. SPP-AMP-3]|uniref:hypothetical protein n=1 Tax=Haladaptatus sp. SPP-AMP-3 TaxID=3121295 RepID=UPI003C303518
MAKKKSESESYSDYQKRLSDQIGDGGGCAEAWEAAEKTRNTGSVGRRRYMVGMAGALLFGANAVDAASAKRKNSEDIEEQVRNTKVQKLKGEKKHAAVQSALSDTEILRRELNKYGFQKTDVQSATVTKSTYERKSHLVVKIPFEPANPSETSDNSNVRRSSSIIWDSRDTGITQGNIETREIAKESEISDDVSKLIEKSDMDLSNRETVPVQLTNTIISPDPDSSGSVSTKTHSRVVPVAKQPKSSAAQAAVQADGDVTTNALIDCVCTAGLGTNPVTACAPCGTIDNACVTQIIATFGPSIAVCGGCLAGGIPVVPLSVTACASCIMGIFQNIAKETIGNLCCWCNFGGDWI